MGEAPGMLVRVAGQSRDLLQVMAGMTGTRIPGYVLRKWPVVSRLGARACCLSVHQRSLTGATLGTVTSPVLQRPLTHLGTPPALSSSLLGLVSPGGFESLAWRHARSHRGGAARFRRPMAALSPGPGKGALPRLLP
jgi:hypothetical protein